MEALANIIVIHFFIVIQKKPSGTVHTVPLSSYKYMTSTRSLRKLAICLQRPCNYMQSQQVPAILQHRTPEDRWFSLFNAANLRHAEHPKAHPPHPFLLWCTSALCNIEICQSVSVYIQLSGAYTSQWLTYTTIYI